MWKLEESSEMRTKIKINQEQTEWQIQVGYHINAMMILVLSMFINIVVTA